MPSRILRFNIKNVGATYRLDAPLANVFFYRSITREGPDSPQKRRPPAFFKSKIRTQKSKIT